MVQGFLSPSEREFRGGPLLPDDPPLAIVTHQTEGLVGDTKKGPRPIAVGIMAGVAMNHALIGPDEGGGLGRIIGIDVLEIQIGRSRPRGKDHPVFVPIRNGPVSSEGGRRIVAEQSPVR